MYLPDYEKAPRYINTPCKECPNHAWCSKKSLVVLEIRNTPLSLPYYNLTWAYPCFGSVKSKKCVVLGICTKGCPINFHDPTLDISHPAITSPCRFCHRRKENPLTIFPKLKAHTTMALLTKIKRGDSL